MLLDSSGGTHGTYHKKLHRILNSVEILHGFHKASVKLTAEIQYNFHGACLPFLQKDSSMSMD